MINILYEDNEILVVRKPVGLESQASRKFEPDMVSEIKNYLYRSGNGRGNKEPYVGVIHRLDKPVGGILVYAKTPNAAKDLSVQVQNGAMKKQYLAVLCGKPAYIVDNYVDNLLKCGKDNTSRIVDKGVKDSKRAELSYHVLEQCEKEGKWLSLVNVELKTGRHHQIRVQFSGHGTPLYGDLKYGGWGHSLALFAYQLSFLHPKTKKRMMFRELPEGEGFAVFQNTINQIGVKVSFDLNITT